MDSLSLPYRIDVRDRLMLRAQAIVKKQPEETWDGVTEVLRTALALGLERLEKDAGILTPNQLSGGD